jgi:hypothetical protein
MDLVHLRLDASDSLPRSTPVISAPMIGVSFSTAIVSYGSSSPVVCR